MSTQIASSTVPGLPSQVDLKILETSKSQGDQKAAVRYILYYREGRNPHPQFVAFDHNSSDMKIIVERSKRFCDVMGQRFVSVSPMVIDLDEQERKRRGES